jgi:hypothetical protein
MRPSTTDCPRVAAFNDRLAAQSTRPQPRVPTMRRMLSTRHSDIELSCACCGDRFVYSAGEQELLAVRGVHHQPRECPPCRKLLGRT